MDKETEEEVQLTRTAIPGDQLDRLDRPYLGPDSYQHEFETFKHAWLEYAPKLRDKNEGYLSDKLWRCMVRDISEALESKIGAERITQISSSQLMVEIELGCLFELSTPE